MPTKVDAFTRGDRKRRLHLLPCTVIEGIIAPAEGHAGGAAERQPRVGGGHDRNGGEEVVATRIQIGDRTTHKHSGEGQVPRIQNDLQLNGLLVERRSTAHEYYANGTVCFGRCERSSGLKDWEAQEVYDVADKGPYGPEATPPRNTPDMNTRGCC